MSINVWPLDAASSSPSYTGRALRETTGAVWARDYSRPLGARSGVVAGSFTPAQRLATISGTTYTIKAHCGVLDVESNAAAGPYAYAISADVNGTTTALTSGQYRRDLISITLTDPAEDGSSDPPGAALTYTVGTPNASSGSAVTPSTPALSMPLAVVLVPPVGSPSISVSAPNTAAAGGIIPQPSTNIVSAGLAQTEGQFIYWPGTTHVGPLWYLDSASECIPLVQGGNEDYTILSGENDITGSVSFSLAALSVAPIVVATIVSNVRDHGVEVSSINTTGFNWRVFKTDGTNAGTNQVASFNWIAIP